MANAHNKRRAGVQGQKGEKMARDGMPAQERDRGDEGMGTGPRVGGTGWGCKVRPVGQGCGLGVMGQGPRGR